MWQGAFHSRSSSFVHAGHEHLEAGLLLNGEQLAHVVGHNLNVLLLQDLLTLAVDNELLHEGGSARTVDDEHDLLAGLDADVLRAGH